MRACVAAVVLPIALILPLRWVAPPTTSFMLITRFGERAGATVDYRWMPLARIGRQAPLAMLAGEDQRFFEHYGFDFGSIRDAIEEGGDGGPGRGASTITQQVAKNLYLWPGHSWVRKGLEAWLAVWLEALLPKRRILEIYVNIAQLGPAVFGVEAASRTYFRKPAIALTRAEAARLAAVLPNPVRFRVDRPTVFVQAREAWILGQMNHLGSFD